MKSFGNTDSSTTTSNVPDVVFWGDTDLWKLICKASSKQEKWMKSTKAMEIANVGCLVQVTTQYGEEVLIESLTFAPMTKIEEEKAPESSDVIARRLVPMTPV